MNIVEFLKNAPALCEIVPPPAAVPSPLKRVIQGQAYRGYGLHAEQRVRLMRPLSRYPLCDMPPTLGWNVWAETVPPGASIRVTLHCGEAEAACVDVPLPAGVLTPVPLPQITSALGPQSELDLTCSWRGCDGHEIFLAVHEVLNRQPLYDFCIGSGVEIGPGGKPQIFADERRQVTYVEQKSVDEWFQLYDIAGATHNVDVWSHYVVGEAHDLPVSQGGCDFIFSSHVLEHLANPIGHLDRWLSHLRSGGHVVGVVPDMAATKDHMMEPSGLDELLEEYRRGGFEPELRHYMRARRKYGPDYPAERAMAEKRSIHIHYYLPRTLARVLTEASHFLPIAAWSIRATPNHKDFHFVIRKR